MLERNGGNKKKPKIQIKSFSENETKLSNYTDALKCKYAYEGCDYQKKNS